MPFETTGQERADNFQRLGGADEGFVTNNAAGNWLFGQSGSSWLFMESKELAAAATSVTFTGLDGDADRAYRLVFELGPVVEPTSPQEFYLQPNGVSANQETIRWQTDNLSPFLNFFNDASGLVMTHLDKIVPATVTDITDLAGPIDADQESDTEVSSQGLVDTIAAIGVPGPNDVQLTSTAAPHTAGFWNGWVMHITSGAGAGEFQTIVASSLWPLPKYVTLAAPFSPAVLVGDSYEIVVAVGSPGVVSWGHGSHAALQLEQFTSSSQPALVTNGAPIGSLDSIVFDGVDDAMKAPGGGMSVSGHTFCISMVVKLPPPGATANEQVFLICSSSAYAAALTIGKPAASDSIRVHRYTAGGTSCSGADGNGFTLGQWAVVTVSNNGGLLTLYINGTLQGSCITNQFGSAWGYNGLTIGAASGTGTDAADCEFAALAEYDRTLTDAERTGLEIYLANKYGVSAYSPGGGDDFASGWVDFYAETGAKRLMHGYDTWLVPSDPNLYRENNSFASWTDTATNITSLTVAASVVNGLPAGSRIALYKIDQVPAGAPTAVDNDLTASVFLVEQRHPTIDPPVVVIAKSTLIANDTVPNPPATIDTYGTFTGCELVSETSTDITVRATTDASASPATFEYKVRDNFGVNSPNFGTVSMTIQATSYGSCFVSDGNPDEGLITVPLAASLARVEVWGAAGADAIGGPAQAGRGESYSVEVVVSPGDVLEYAVGQMGAQGALSTPTVPGAKGVGGAVNVAGIGPNPADGFPISGSCPLVFDGGPPPGTPGTPVGGDASPGVAAGMDGGSGGGAGSVVWRQDTASSNLIAVAGGGGGAGGVAGVGNAGGTAGDDISCSARGRSMDVPGGPAGLGGGGGGFVGGDRLAGAVPDVGGPGGGAGNSGASAGVISGTEAFGIVSSWRKGRVRLCYDLQGANQISALAYPAGTSGLKSRGWQWYTVNLQWFGSPGMIVGATSGGIPNQEIWRMHEIKFDFGAWIFNTSTIHRARLSYKMTNNAAGAGVITTNSVENPLSWSDWGDMLSTIGASTPAHSELFTKTIDVTGVLQAKMAAGSATGVTLYHIIAGPQTGQSSMMDIIGPDSPLLEVDYDL